MRFHKFKRERTGGEVWFDLDQVAGLQPVDGEHTTLMGGFWSYTVAMPLDEVLALITAEKPGAAPLTFDEAQARYNAMRSAHEQDRQDAKAPTPKRLAEIRRKARLFELELLAAAIKREFGSLHTFTTEYMRRRRREIEQEA